MHSKIIAIEPRNEQHLWLKYEDGAEGALDLAPIAEKGGELSALMNHNTFHQARIGENGRYVEWPGEIDLCADALYLRLRELREAS